ncbi:MAG: hypothetical protein HYS86_02940 [Candidatus Chisholmbacteria bacterium]|nr:hypothetical protein [Candidatus Chisholmbacteria bacterium]
MGDGTGSLEVRENEGRENEAVSAVLDRIERDKKLADGELAKRLSGLYDFVRNRFDQEKDFRAAIEAGDDMVLEWRDGGEFLVVDPSKATIRWKKAGKRELMMRTCYSRQGRSEDLAWRAQSGTQFELFFAPAWGAASVAVRGRNVHARYGNATSPWGAIIYEDPQQVFAAFDEALQLMQVHEGKFKFRQMNPETDRRGFGG